eukprot:2544892-Pyramimonas_sp.AAC.2
MLGCEGAHTFHGSCAKKWLEKNRTCPLCRADVAKVQASNSRTGAKETSLASREKARALRSGEEPRLLFTNKSHKLLQALLKENS